MARLEDIELPEGDSAGTIHLNPAAQFYPRVLLPGDPARAMAIATTQLTAPRMFNHRRGLWGYSGETEGGVGFTIQASGMGGPSAAIVAEELCDLGAEVIVRVGTCGAIDPQVKLGDIVVVTEAICADGTSRALSGELSIAADPELAARLTEHASASGRKTHTGKVGTVDLFYDPQADATHEELLADGALAIEMEAAAVFAVAKRRGVKAACVLGVSDELYDARRERLAHDELTELGEVIGAVAFAALEAI